MGRIGTLFAPIITMKRASLLFCVVLVTAQTASAVEWDLANMPNPRVDYWLTRLQTDKRAKFTLFMHRKPKYEDMIERKLAKRGMPRDLIYLAMIESGFDPKIKSRAGARGMWQLVPDTARRYGLKVNKKVDERMDPVKSTDAALDYLDDLHDRFGSWYLAAAAYNTGENRVGRVMRSCRGKEEGHDKDYYRICRRLPGQTRDYVPIMIAAARICKQPAKYGFAAPAAKQASTDKAAHRHASRQVADAARD